ncbi:hypothetical protein [Fodinibius salsisoli]|uniref:Uncharacterized protein n=1 Tax=Fodinibius salsisoli TaxID=2820877 RepID=A0ABT3PQB2_9BACT|nr:hypothetical protein [Fodinibius salsisoli]MCW9708049.1 hypothetical protein [Fodinibius salsisoli]
MRTLSPDDQARGYGKNPPFQLWSTSEQGQYMPMVLATNPYARYRKIQGPLPPPIKRCELGVTAWSAG